MDQHSILHIITTLRSELPIRIQCYALYKILKAIFPEAECYYFDHVIIKIGPHFYDWNGLVEDPDLNLYCPIEIYGDNIIQALEKGKEGFYGEEIKRYVARRLKN